MDQNDTTKLIWLAATYHMPATYSCRVPMSSMNSALAMPAPSPATVRLAMIRVGIELFGLSITQNELFPIIRSAPIRIKPPGKVGISTQTLRAYKANAKGKLVESVIYREIAHCEGPLTIYLNIPTFYKTTITTIMKVIGYWGQAHSLAHCLQVSECKPINGECAVALSSLQLLPLENLFACFVTEFRENEVQWASILPAIASSTGNIFLTTMLHLWPLIIEHQSTGKILYWHSLNI